MNYPFYSKIIIDRKEIDEDLMMKKLEHWSLERPMFKNRLFLRSEEWLDIDSVSLCKRVEDFKSHSYAYSEAVFWRIEENNENTLIIIDHCIGCYNEYMFHLNDRTIISKSLLDDLQEKWDELKRKWKISMDDSNYLTITTNVTMNSEGIYHSKHMLDEIDIENIYLGELSFESEKDKLKSNHGMFFGPTKSKGNEKDHSMDALFEKVKERISLYKIFNDWLTYVESKQCFFQRNKSYSWEKFYIRMTNQLVRDIEKWRRKECGKNHKLLFQDQYWDVKSFYFLCMILSTNKDIRTNTKIQHAVEISLKRIESCILFYKIYIMAGGNHGHLEKLFKNNIKENIDGKIISHEDMIFDEFDVDEEKTIDDYISHKFMDWEYYRRQSLKKYFCVNNGWIFPNPNFSSVYCNGNSSIHPNHTNTERTTSKINWDRICRNGVFKKDKVPFWLMDSFSSLPKDFPIYLKSDTVPLFLMIECYTFQKCNSIERIFRKSSFIDIFHNNEYLQDSILSEYRDIIVHFFGDVFSKKGISEKLDYFEIFGYSFNENNNNIKINIGVEKKNTFLKRIDDNEKEKKKNPNKKDSFSKYHQSSHSHKHLGDDDDDAEDDDAEEQMNDSERKKKFKHNENPEGREIPDIEDLIGKDQEFYLTNREIPPCIKFSTLKFLDPENKHPDYKQRHIWVSFLANNWSFFRPSTLYNESMKKVDSLYRSFFKKEEFPHYPKDLKLFWKTKHGMEYYNSWKSSNTRRNMVTGESYSYSCQSVQDQGLCPMMQNFSQNKNKSLMEKVTWGEMKRIDRNLSANENCGKLFQKINSRKKFFPINHPNVYIKKRFY